MLRWVLVIGGRGRSMERQVHQHWPNIRARLFSVVLMAVFGFTGFNALYYVAAHYTTAINIGILQGCMPMFVLAGAFVAHGTRATYVQVVGAMITTLGVVVIASRGAPPFGPASRAQCGRCLDADCLRLYAFFTVALRDRPAMPGAAFFTLLAMIAALTSIPLALYEPWSKVRRCQPSRAR